MILRTGIYSALATCIKLGVALAATKLIALLLGAEGLGRLGHFSNLIATMTVTCSCGLSLAITRHSAAAQFGDGQVAMRSLSVAFGLVIWSSLISAIILFAAGGYIEGSLSGTHSDGNLFRMSGVFALPIGLSVGAAAYLSGLGDGWLLAKYQALTGVAGLVGLGIGVYFWGHSGGALGMLWLASSGSIYVLFRPLVTHLKRFDIRSVLALRGAPIAPLLGFFLMTLNSAIVNNSLQSYIRGQIGDSSGWAEAGYWQASTRISDAFLQVFYVFLAIYLIPRLSRAGSIRAGFAEVERCWGVIIPAAISCACIAYFLKGTLVYLLYSESFSPVEMLLKPQLIGDVAKVAAFVPGYLLISNGYTLVSVAADYVQLGLYLALLYFGAFRPTALEMCQVYCYTYIVYLILVLVVYFSFKHNSNEA